MGKKEQRKRDRRAVVTIAQKLAALEKMTVSELAEKYREVFGVPTRSRNKGFLRKRVAWRIQELAEGGLSQRALARIEELAPQARVRWNRSSSKSVQSQGTAAEPCSTRDSRLPPPGSVLVRVHKKVEHRVTVLEDGFEYKGKRFDNLSRLACQITGTRWNGFGFFGLLQRSGKAAKSAKGRA